MSVASGDPIAGLDTLATLANSKTTLSGKPYSFPQWAGDSRAPADNPKWFTELNRLRGNVQSAIDGSWNISFYDLDVSGSWPISAPSFDYLNQAFYYADTGSVETVTINGATFGDQATSHPAGTTDIIRANIHGSGAANLLYVNKYGLYNAPYSKKIELVMIVGGIEDATLEGDFYFKLGATQGFTCVKTGTTYHDVVVTTADPSSMVTVDASEWPFGSYEVFFKLVDFGSVGSPPFGGHGNGYVYVVWHINQVVSPGTYKVIVEVDVPADDTETVVIPFVEWNIVVNPRVKCDNGVLFNEGTYYYETWPDNNWFYAAGMMCAGLNTMTSTTDRSGSASLYQVESARSVYVDGIHNSKTIYTIPLGSWSPSIIFEGEYRKPPTVYAFEFYPGYKRQIMGGSYVASCDGLWTGTIPMVSNLNAATPSVMPWNRLVYNDHGGLPLMNPALIGNQGYGHTESNSYDQTKPVELQNEPAVWDSYTYFTEGFVIIDYNGNLQQAMYSAGSDGGSPSWKKLLGQITTDGYVQWQCIYSRYASDTWLPSMDRIVGDTIIDSKGDVQTCTQGGTSGLVEPYWLTGLGDITEDGGALWELTSFAVPIKPKVIPAVHRPVSVPRYPVYWVDETEARMKPPTSTSGLTVWGAWEQWRRHNYTDGFTGHDDGWQEDNLAYGWWIYSISINRVEGNIVSGVNFPATEQISVNVGCIRNGSFQSFGTFQTGTTHNVLWPVFTSDALVYQCAERVDIQAVAIATSGTKGVSIGTGVALNYPIAATYVNDVTALLGLIT